MFNLLSRTLLNLRCYHYIHSYHFFFRSSKTTLPKLLNFIFDYKTFFTYLDRKHIAVSSKTQYELNTKGTKAKIELCCVVWNSTRIDQAQTQCSLSVACVLFVRLGFYQSARARILYHLGTP